VRVLIHVARRVISKRPPWLTYEEKMALHADAYRAMLENNAHNFTATGCDYSRAEKIAITCATFGIDHDAQRAREKAKQRESKRVAWKPVQRQHLATTSADGRWVTRPKRKRYDRSNAMTDQARRALLDVKVCAYCGETPETDRDDLGATWHIDHVVPISKGGADDLSNMVKACRRCNLRKHAKTWVPHYGTLYADGHVEERSGPDQRAGEREKGKKLAHPAAEAGQMA
jgi:5-methylcytosine-specific restriction endonuclease McrA